MGTNPATKWTAAAASLLLLATACGRETSSSGPSLEEQRARERAAAFFARDNRAAALEALTPLLERAEPEAQDLVRAAVVYRSQGSLEEATAALERALALEPESASAHYGIGQLALFDGDNETAIEHLARARELAPGDVPTRLGLALALEESRPEEALALYREVRSLGLDEAGSFYLTTLFRLHRLLRSRDELEQAQPVLAEYERLLERGFVAPSSEQVARGKLGNLVSPGPLRNEPAKPGSPPAFAAAAALDIAGADAQILAAATSFLVTDLDNDGLDDVLLYGPSGFQAALQGEGRALTAMPAIAFENAAGASLLIAFDVDNDDDLDLALARGAGVELWVAERQAAVDGATIALTYAPPTAPFLAPGGTVHDMIAVDYDHDGDLDLALVSDAGPRIARNDAAGVEGGFNDATEEAGIPPGTYSWLRAEDWDTDQDVDLVLGSASEVTLASNVRGGRFEDASALLGDLPPSDIPPVLRDLDGDGRPDILWNDPGEGVRAWASAPSGRAQEADAAAVPNDRSTGPLPGDLDLDGTLDLLVLQSGEWRAAMSTGLSTQAVAEVTLDAEPDARAAWLGDFDADLALELVTLGASGLRIHDAEASEGKSLLLSLRGVKDNRRGIGAVVELRTGPTYQRLFWTGHTRLLGASDAETLDWLRITWPNGVVQYDPRLDLGDRRVTNDPLEAFKQVEGLVGSCPFLYSWNGETFEFVSDVLGITPLGLPMAPGQLVPPDHDEYVLVRGDQLQPRDGLLELQFTEELREVTYLDRIALVAVDHPADTEVFPEERFTFPPFPEPHNHTIRGALSPTSAVDQSGTDWTTALATIDDVHAVPFEPAPSQYLGLATPHTLELTFDAERAREARKLRLVLTGWFYWTDASVNMAVARDPGWSFVPPILSVPDGDGGWRETGPPIGFPAGKSKTMVVDVTGLVDPAEPRLRLTSTLRLYWDSIRLAVDNDDAELRVTELDPTSARLWRRGFSAPIGDPSGQLPERFAWERLAERPRWNPHPGLYTKLGETLPLVTGVDDRFVIMGSGEALTVRFDASALPALPEGFVRDYLVYLDGWAKDRDPNTHEALFVEPLPFHGMSAYPYGPDESFPDTPAHRAWRREWNTRSAEAWLSRGPEERTAGAAPRATGRAMDASFSK